MVHVTKILAIEQLRFNGRHDFRSWEWTLDLRLDREPEFHKIWQDSLSPYPPPHQPLRASLYPTTLENICDITQFTNMWCTDAINTYLSTEMQREVHEATIADLERYEVLTGQKIGKIFSDNVPEYKHAFSARYKTPYEMFHGTKPKVDHLRTIGCTAYVLIPPKDRSFKLAPSAQLARLVRYSANRKAYRVVYPNHKIMEVRDISFNEAENLAEQKGFPGPDAQILGNHDDPAPNPQNLPPEQPSHHGSPDPPANRRSGRTNHLPGQYKEHQLGYAVLAADQVPIPKTYKEALSSEYSAEWSAAMTAELATLFEMKTWTLSELPPGSKPIGTKWVFDLKLLVSEEIDGFKARLVAKGYAQRPGMDYDELEKRSTEPNHQDLGEITESAACGNAYVDSSKHPGSGQPETGIPLAQIVGSLNYLAVNTTPDIAQAVNRLVRHSSRPLHAHMETAMGIVKYLAGTPDHGITYIHSRKPMTGYCDSAHAACPITRNLIRKSTTGWVFSNQGGAISWQSKIQASTTALSSTEAEYVAATSAAQEAMWLRK
eukprot:gene9075-biopygen8963